MNVDSNVSTNLLDPVLINGNNHTACPEATFSNISNSLPPGRGFKIACLNINSLTRHIDERRIHLDDYSIDILSLNETKLDDSIKSCEIHIPGYELIRRDRDTNGGGVCFYLKTSINFVARSDLNVANLENLCLEIRKPNSKPFFVVTWYRPPCSSIESFLFYESLISKLDSLGSEYYLVGDFNCSMASSHHDTNTRRLCEISDLYGLHQLITEPTRITESSSSLIDLIYTNYVDRVVCSGVSHISISDHSLIYVYRKLSTDLPFKGHFTISYRNFRNFNRGKFRNDICQQDWNCNSDDPNILWADWKGTFLSIVNIHAPSRTKRIRSHKAPWINSELKKGMRDRDAAKRKAAKSNDPCDWAKYKKLRNLINNRIKTAKASYYSKAFIQFEGNSRKTWQTINELTSRRKKQRDCERTKSK